MPTDKKLSDLVINDVESPEVYDQISANNLLNEDEIYLVSEEDSEDDTLYLTDVPTTSTVGRKGQIAIVTKYKNSTTDTGYYFICYGYMTNGGVKQYIWAQLNSANITHPEESDDPSITPPAAGEPIVIRTSGTYKLSDLGLTSGDRVTIAAISGGNGGYGNDMNTLYGADAGKGGPVHTFEQSANAAGYCIPGGGGGAGNGYGGGGGGAGGTSDFAGGNGGEGGICVVKTVTLSGTSVSVTIGQAGKGIGWPGASTTNDAARIGGTTSFGSYVTAAGGTTGAAGGKGQPGSENPDTNYTNYIWAAGGGGGGGGGWYFVSSEAKCYGAGSDGYAETHDFTAAGTYEGMGGVGGHGGGSSIGTSSNNYPGHGGSGGWMDYAGTIVSEAYPGRDGDKGGHGAVLIWK